MATSRREFLRLLGLGTAGAATAAAVGLPVIEDLATRPHVAEDVPPPEPVEMNAAAETWRPEGQNWYGLYPAEELTTPLRIMAGPSATVNMLEWRNSRGDLLAAYPTPPPAPFAGDAFSFRLRHIYGQPIASKPNYLLKVVTE